MTVTTNTPRDSPNTPIHDNDHDNDQAGRNAQPERTRPWMPKL